jgi:hypothetical protein
MSIFSKYEHGQPRMLFIVTTSYCLTGDASFDTNSAPLGSNSLPTLLSVKSNHSEGYR